MVAEAKAGEGELRLGEQPGKRNAKYTGSFFNLLEVLSDALRLAGGILPPPASAGGRCWWSLLREPRES